MSEKPRELSGDGKSPSPQNGGNGRRYWIDEDGNVHGVVLSMVVDHFIEFTDKAVDLTPKERDSGQSST
jgi:hypothetical protein